MPDRGVKRILIDQKTLSRRVKELGKEITRDYREGDLTVVLLLEGGVVFAADLMRAIHLPMQTVSLRAESYFGGSVSTGVVKLGEGADRIRSSHVLVVDDILDSGRTLLRVLEAIREMPGIESVGCCVLLDKQVEREVEIRCDYTGFVIEPVFVVGYGMDYKGYYRNLPYIGEVDPAQC